MEEGAPEPAEDAPKEVGGPNFSVTSKPGRSEKRASNTALPKSKSCAATKRWPAFVCSFASAGLGRPDVAAAGQLFVIAAGSADAIAAATPLFDAIGQKTFVVAETPKAANRQAAATF